MDSRGATARAPGASAASAVSLDPVHTLRTVALGGSVPPPRKPPRAMAEAGLRALCSVRLPTHHRLPGRLATAQLMLLGSGAKLAKWDVTPVPSNKQPSPRLTTPRRSGSARSAGCVATPALGAPSGHVLKS